LATTDGGSGRDRAARGRWLILAAAVLWSLGGVVTKALPLDSQSIALYRSLFAGLALLPLVPRSRWVFRPAMAPLGLAFGGMTGLYLGSVKGTTAANAIILQCTAAIWMVPLGRLFLGERADRRSLLAIGLAGLGFAVIAAFGRDGRPGESAAVALGLSSGLMYALVVIGMRGLRDLDPLWLSSVNNLGGAATMAGWLLATRGSIPVPTPGQATALFGFGVVQMAIPYALFAQGLRDVDAAQAGLIALAEPILSPLWVYLAQGERPMRATIVGGMLLLSGVACRFWPIDPPRGRAG